MSLTTKQREALTALAEVMQEHNVNFWSEEGVSICVEFPPVFHCKYKTTTHADIKQLLQEQE